MELNRQQKVGMALAALAIAALGVDRFVLGNIGPATASAQIQAPVVLNTAAIQLEKTRQKETLAGRLDAYAAIVQETQASGVYDIFTPDEVWTITSIFGTGNRAGVRIGGKTVRIGQEYHGAKLIRVTRDGAVFSRQGGEIYASFEHVARQRDR